VGSEYHLTRGHYHQKRDHAEIYQALSGRGLVLFEREDGTTCTAKLEPGKVAYIPPFWGASLRQHLRHALSLPLDLSG
jgi:glucose-6-phosphate isomerase, archaeal